jgi:hypothetical protein
MTSHLQFVIQFERQYADSLDPDLHFTTDAFMQEYLLNPRRYKGMIVSCDEHEGVVFILNNAKNEWLTVSGSTGVSVPKQSYVFHPEGKICEPNDLFNNIIIECPVDGTKLNKIQIQFTAKVMNVSFAVVNDAGIVLYNESVVCVPGKKTTLILSNPELTPATNSVYVAYKSSDFITIHAVTLTF